MTHLHLETKERILFLTLTGEALRNPFGVEEARALQSALSNTKALNGIILKSTSKKVFCSGGNLKEYSRAKKASEGIKINREIRGVLTKLFQTPIPKLALVEGDCYGGGLELISGFDLVLCAPNACFGFWQRRVGLTFGWGGGYRMILKMKRHQLLQRSLEGRTISSYEAQSIGLIDEVVSARILLPTAMDWLENINKWPQQSFIGFKKWNPKQEVSIFEKLWFNSEHQEKLKQFSKT